MLMTRKTGLKIEYFDDDEGKKPVEVESEIVEEAEFVEVSEEPKYYEPRDDVDEYVYQERVGILRFVNYLPRVPKAVLRGERDFTSEEWTIASSDFDKGFRPIASEYLDEYQVPDDTYLYRTQEDLSRNIVKLSSGMVAKWVRKTTASKPALFPQNLLKDDFGFTQYAVAIYRNLMRYTCTRRFTCDWNEIDRDASLPPIKNPEFSEENPDYAMSGLYWERLAAQYQDYCDCMEWIADYKRSRSLREQKPEFINVASEEQQYYQTLSESAKRIELAVEAYQKFVLAKVGQVCEKTKDHVRKAAAVGEAEAFEVMVEVVAKNTEPQPLEEEVDLWSEE